MCVLNHNRRGKRCVVDTSFRALRSSPACFLSWRAPIPRAPTAREAPADQADRRAAWEPGALRREAADQAEARATGAVVHRLGAADRLASAAVDQLEPRAADRVEPRERAVAQEKVGREAQSPTRDRAVREVKRTMPALLTPAHAMLPER